MGEGRTQIDSVEHSKHIFLLCVSRYATVILSDAFRASQFSEAGKTLDWTVDIAARADPTGSLHIHVAHNYSFLEITGPNNDEISTITPHLFSK